jgi:hypothetical protein
MNVYRGKAARTRVEVERVQAVLEIKLRRRL